MEVEPCDLISRSEKITQLLIQWFANWGSDPSPPGFVKREIAGTHAQGFWFSWHEVELENLHFYTSPQGG